MQAGRHVAPDRGIQNERPSVAEAAQRLTTATQRLIARRLDLAAREGRESIRNVAAIAAGAVLLLFGWAHVVAAIIDLLTAFLARPYAQLLVGLLHMLAAGLVVGIAQRGQAKGTASPPGTTGVDVRSREG